MAAGICRCVSPGRAPLPCRKPTEGFSAALGCPRPSQPLCAGDGAGKLPFGLTPVGFGDYSQEELSPCDSVMGGRGDRGSFPKLQCPGFTRIGGRATGARDTTIVHTASKRQSASGLPQPDLGR